MVLWLWNCGQSHFIQPIRYIWMNVVCEPNIQRYVFVDVCENVCAEFSHRKSCVAHLMCQKMGIFYGFRQHHFHLGWAQWMRGNFDAVVNTIQVICDRCIWLEGQIVWGSSNNSLKITEEKGKNLVDGRSPMAHGQCWLAKPILDRETWGYPVKCEYPPQKYRCTNELDEIRLQVCNESYTNKNLSNPHLSAIRSNARYHLPKPFFP